MPQGRIVLKSICQSKKLPKLKTDGARLLYTWLIPNADINGCFSGDPQVIKGQVFTRLNHSIKTIESYLQDLESNDLIMRYEVNGDLFLHILQFQEKQPYLNPKREAEPTIVPPTPEQLQSNSRQTHAKSKSKSKSKEKVKESEEEYKKRINFFFSHLEPDWLVEMAKAYPTIDIEKELQKAKAWLVSNPQKAKKNFKRFINNWLKNSKPEERRGKL